MKKRVFLMLISALIMAVIFTFAAMATENGTSLWSQKPTSGAVHSGYCIDANGAQTNIKFEVYNEGTADAPDYTIYFFMEDPNGGSVVYPGRTDTNGYDATTTDAGWNCAMSNGRASVQAWYAPSVYDAQKITKAVFGDGITELGGTATSRGILTCLRGLKTVEFPASLTRMVSATFESCIGLRTVYTRDVGQTVEEGTVNLSNFTHMNFGTYAFASCQSVAKYVFADTVTTDTPQIGQYCFGFNTTLKSLNIPNGITKTYMDMFFGNPASGTWTLCPLEEITLPESLAELWASTFRRCYQLHTVTFLGANTNVYPKEGTGTIADAIVENDYGTSFGTCSALTTIKALDSSNAKNFAERYGFNFVEIEAPEVELPIDTVTSTCGALIMTYDPNTKTMTVDTNEAGWTAFVTAHWWNGPDGSVHCAEPLNFMGKYKDEMEHFVIGGNIDELAVGNSTWSSYFDGFTALKTFRFTNPIKLTLGSKGNLFANCTNLTSVYVGDESNAQAGVADLSSFTSCDSGVLMGLFTNCTSLTKVLLPTAAGASSIYTSTFDGCTALRTVSIPANITAIAENAFEDCPLEAVIAPEGSAGYKYAAENDLLPTLWSQKPESGAVHSGYCVDETGTATNIKFEIYNMGTAEAPEYTIYFFMEDPNGGSVVYPCTSTGAYIPTSDGMYWVFDHGCNMASGMIWASATADVYTKITKAVFGDGITELAGGAEVRGILSSLVGLKTVEFPASLTKMTSATFESCQALSTVYTRDTDQKVTAGTVNLSNFSHINFGSYAFANCYSIQNFVFADTITTDTPQIGKYCFVCNTGLKSLTIPNGITKTYLYMFSGDPNFSWSLPTALTEVTLPETMTDVWATTFQYCSNLTTVNVTGSATKLFPAGGAASKEAATVQNDWGNSFGTCTALTTINAPVGSPAHTFAWNTGFETSHYSIFEDEDGSQIKLEYFPENQHMSITKLDTSYVELFWDSPIVQTFIATYKPYVKTAEVGFIHKLRSNSNVEFGLFEGFEALTEVHFESLTLAPYWGCTDVDLFKGCKSLTTLWVGDDSNKIDGVINFTGFVETDKMPEKVLKGMFSGCEAITKVILPNLSNAGYESNGQMVYPISTIHANTFEGCTALAEIVIPENYGVVEDGAFANLTSLRKIDLKEKDITLPAAAFTGCSKVVIFCSDVETAKALNASLAEAAVNSDVAIAFAPSIKILGFQVREAEYNGLRTLYSFNEKIYGETDGIELVEYGSIIASKDNYDKYSKQLGGTDAILTLDGGKFVTPAENVVKTAIWNENDGYSGKSNHEDATNVRFNTTIIRYSDELQMKSAVSMVGYEIWRMNGEYYLLITEYEDANYASPSLYNITLGMLTAEESILSLAKGDNPVWQTVNMCAETTITTDNEAVIGLLLADPANEDKYIALYATEEADEVTFGDLGTDKLTREKISATVIGKNVVYALPELDAVWADYMSSKVEEIPEGKSFVFITDTHWNNNAKKSSSLIDYVRKATGITNVVYGGDPFDGFDSLAAAQDALTTYAQTNFYDVFGEDGIYVVGNHDVNHTASGGKAELTISDTFLYNTTVKNIENKAIFDTDMLAALENITYSEVLNSDGTVAYTSAEMKEQALAWAKMHYHYDNTDNKIRYIVLDTGSNGITQLNTIIGNYTSFMSIEYDWLAKTLMSTPASYDIVVLGHQIGESTANSVASRDLFQILSAFKAKTAITANLTAHSNNTLAIMGGTTTRTYDFSASEFDGTIFSMNGHWHYDRSWIWQTELGTYGTNVAYSDSMTLSDDAILSICCNRDAMWSPGEIEMTGGTETEQSFSVITLTDDGRIVLTRFGAGESKTFIYE